jgi:hypothetical protein
VVCYVLCKEELLIRINESKEIKGYEINVIKRFEIKTSSYADDVAGILGDKSSVDMFFQYFKEWGKYSGASLNEMKTQILVINSTEDLSEYNLAHHVKILGIVFDKQGISNENLRIIREKMNVSMIIWSSMKLNMIEKITVCKYFVLSKLWYLAQFREISKRSVRDKILVYAYE